ncbi:MAG: hypothetical protein NTX52_11130 [Planctomycetota bacterium]|nr:hypothetical protein [Planctomycetota bacterium]
MRYVYCHPLFDERKCAHRFSYQLKNTFQKVGLTLERFDYHGTGEAAGEFADVSLQSLLEDIVTQVGSSEVCLIGLRFSASLAFDFCARGSGQVRNLILLEPIIDGAQYLDYLYRKQHIKDLMTGKYSCELQEKDYVNLEGYKTSIKFTEQIKNFHLLEIAREYPVKSSIYIVQISNQSKVDPKITDMAELLKTSAKQVLVDSVRLPIFWERIPATNYTELTQKVLRWCCE